MSTLAPVALLSALAACPPAALARPFFPADPVIPSAWQEAAEPVDPDARTHYDVRAYWLDLRVEPRRRRIEGSVAVEVEVTAEHMPVLELDLAQAMQVERVESLLEPLDLLVQRPPGERAPLAVDVEFERSGDRLRCKLVEPAERGRRVALRVHYSGSPRAIDEFDGFHWSETPAGKPWIATSCQTLGAHFWWPCKASFFHPEDKPERVFVDLTVPAGLYAVSNGRLEGRHSTEEGWETFRWRHPYPLETYSVTLNVAPYLVSAQRLELEGVQDGVPFNTYMLPEDVDKAGLQFAVTPGILRVFAEHFGPWPFPESKVGLVQTPFWGMEHSSAIAYGSSFPDWCLLSGERDPYASRNRWFDYILVHELAHEWWGNAVSAADWSDFWLHEGFATYAEGVYVEATTDRASADRFFAQMARAVPRRGRLQRARGSTSREAYHPILYAKGGLVLNTLRHYLDDDPTWWQVLRTFQARHRYGNASTADFRDVLEELSGRPWGRVLHEWVEGEGYPRLDGRVVVEDGLLRVRVDNDPPPLQGIGGFHVPLDLEWVEGETTRSERIWLDPGDNELEVPTAGRAREVSVRNLQRVLGKHSVRVE